MVIGIIVGIVALFMGLAFAFVAGATGRMFGMTGIWLVINDVFAFCFAFIGIGGCIAIIVVGCMQ